jgi:hypothetical protein
MPLSAMGADLPAGTYLVDRGFPARATFTVPAGWSPYTVNGQIAGVLVNHARPVNGSGWGFFLMAEPIIPVDPCYPTAGTIPLAQGSAATIVEAFARLPRVDVQASDTTVAGRGAKLLTVTAHPDTATCPDVGAPSS